MLRFYFFFYGQKRAHGNDFAEIPENLNTDLKIIFLDYQNNYPENSSRMSNAASFNIRVAKSLSVLHNYFDNPTKLFLNLYLHRKKIIWLKWSFIIFFFFSLKNVCI